MFDEVKYLILNVHFNPKFGNFSDKTQIVLDLTKICVPFSSRINANNFVNFMKFLPFMECQVNIFNEMDVFLRGPINLDIGQNLQAELEKEIQKLLAMMQNFKVDMPPSFVCYFSVQQAVFSK